MTVQWSSYLKLPSINNVPLQFSCNNWLMKGRFCYHQRSVAFFAESEIGLCFRDPFLHRRSVYFLLLSLRSVSVFVIHYCTKGLCIFLRCPWGRFMFSWIIESKVDIFFFFLSQRSIYFLLLRLRLVHFFVAFKVSAFIFAILKVGSQCLLLLQKGRFLFYCCLSHKSRFIFST